MITITKEIMKYTSPFILLGASTLTPIVVSTILILTALVITTYVLISTIKQYNQFKKNEMVDNIVIDKIQP